MALLQSHQVARFVVGRAVEPAAMENPDPHEGQSAQSGLVTHAAGATALVESLGPVRAWNGLPDPLDEGLAQEGGARVTPVDPGLLAAAFGYRRDSCVLLKRGSVRKAFAPLSEGDEQPRCERRARTGQGAKELEVGQRRAKVGDLFVEV